MAFTEKKPREWVSVRKIDKTWRVGRHFSVRLSYRGSDGWMGRFGGGWDWKAGFQTSSPSAYGWAVLFSLLVAELTINWKTDAGIESAAKWEETRLKRLAAQQEEDARALLSTLPKEG